MESEAAAAASAAAEEAPAAAAQAADLFRLLRTQHCDGAEVSTRDAEVVDAHALEKREGVIPHLHRMGKNGGSWM
jgi:hypothetical protein